MTDVSGVLVMAHGTPASLDEVLPFYTRIRRGNPPTDAQLDELVGRYRAIGGLSPLTERTVAQVAAIRAGLEGRAPGHFSVTFGAKHTTPAIEDAAHELAAQGVARVIGLVLTPHGSSMGSEEYLLRAADALDGHATLIPVPPWYGHPGFVALMAARVHTTLSDLVAADGNAHPLVVFTAHSLPERVRAAGDRYPAQVEESACLVADAAGLEDWQVAWQSAGRTPEPWFGPDVRDVVREQAADRSGRSVVVCPIGFVADHLEVLYDIDIELAAVAAEAGVRLARTASLNDEPAFIEVLVDAVCAADGAAG